MTRIESQKSGNRATGESLDPDRKSEVSKDFRGLELILTFFIFAKFIATMYHGCTILQGIILIVDVLQDK